MVICDPRTDVVGIAASCVSAFGVAGQAETHGSSGFETDLKNVNMSDSGLRAASVASDWPAACVEPEVFVVAALNAVVWVIVSPLVFACVASCFQPLDLLR